MYNSCYNIIFDTHHICTYIPRSSLQTYLGSTKDSRNKDLVYRIIIILTVLLCNAKSESFNKRRLYTD